MAKSLRISEATAPLERLAALRELDDVTRKEVGDGLIGQGLTKAQMDRRFGRGRWRSIPRFAVEQGAKIRACDNAKASSHNAATAMQRDYNIAHL